MSLRSRNARITGTWKLTSQETSDTFVVGDITNANSTSYDGTTLNTTEAGVTNSVNYSQTIEINKDGTYKMIIVEDGISYENQGNWWWLSSKKRKVRIAFDDDWGSFYIDRLKNKEMVLKIDESNSTSQSGSNSTSTSSGTWTFEKE